MMGTMRNTIFMTMVAASIVAVASCSKDGSGAIEGENVPAPVSFRISARSDASQTSLTRLYVAERIGEHDNGEDLHCCLAEDITEVSSDGSSLAYSLTGMTAQWYKFAFISVPDAVRYGDDAISGAQMFLYDGVTSLPEAKCDFNRIYIDFEPVLKAQKADSTLARTADLHIYRKVIDRWLLPDVTLTEDVLMQRITGRLEIDMGILEDQFPHEIESITLTLNTPEQVYLHDQSAGEVLLRGDSYNDHVFRYESFRWNEGERFIIRVDLLPETVNGNITVKYNGTSESAVYPVYAGNDYVTVKSNTRTVVHFNGIEDGFYEVRYAGFLDGDAIVGVDDDVWDDQL